MRTFRQHCARELVDNNYDHAEHILSETIKKHASLFSNEIKTYLQSRGLFNEPDIAHTLIVEKKPSVIEQRFALDLGYFEALVGKMYQARGGGKRKIEEAGMIRQTRQGVRAGVKIGFYKKDPQRPLSQTLHLDRTEIFLPSTLKAKMEQEQWTETSI